MEHMRLAISSVPRVMAISAIALVLAVSLPVALMLGGQDGAPEALRMAPAQAQSDVEAEADQQSELAAPGLADSSEVGSDADEPVDATPLVPAVLNVPAPPPTATPQLTPSPPPTFTPSVMPMATASPTPRDLTMRAELDVYSGRPNPTWEISTQDANRLLTALRQLPERDTATAPASLGYRGIVLTGGAVQALGYDRLRAFGGVVVAEGPLGRKIFSDRDHEFEAGVAATAEGRVDLSPFEDYLPEQPRRR